MGAALPLRGSLLPMSDLTDHSDDSPTTRPNGRRFVGGVFDWLLLMVMSSTVTWAWHDTVAVKLRNGKTVDQMQPTTGAQVLILCLVSLFWIGCYGRWGRTPGKALVGLKLVTADGGRVSYGRAAIRYVVTDIGWVLAWITPAAWRPVTDYLPTLWPLVIYIPVLVDRLGRGTHDHAAGTVVVVAPLERPPWKPAPDA